MILDAVIDRVEHGYDADLGTITILHLVPRCYLDGHGIEHATRLDQKALIILGIQQYHPTPGQEIWANNIEMRVLGDKRGVGQRYTREGTAFARERVNGAE